jgi:hypothetical protein
MKIPHKLISLFSSAGIAQRLQEERHAGDNETSPQREPRPGAGCKHSRRHTRQCGRGRVR